MPHVIFSSLCVKNICLKDGNELYCKKCGRFIGKIYEDEMWLSHDFKKYEQEIGSTEAVRAYSRERAAVERVSQREWNTLLRDIRSGSHEVFSMESDGRGILKNCDREDTIGY